MTKFVFPAKNPAKFGKKSLKNEDTSAAKNYFIPLSTMS